MIETHPFGDFAPPNARTLILGSFAGRQAVPGTLNTDAAYDWFYGTRRNQFWPILEAVYSLPLKDKRSKQALFSRLGIAIADIIYQCERRDGNNLDANLFNIVYNRPGIKAILENHKIQDIFFTSRFVENRFRFAFQDLIHRSPSTRLICLPSPSPRYATMTMEQKIQRYRELLPALERAGRP